MMVHKKIVDHHGRIENVKLFDKDPTIFIRDAKEKEEAKVKATKEAEKARQLAEEAGEPLEEEIKIEAPVENEVDEGPKEPDYIEFTDKKMTIYDIYKTYGKETKNEVDEEPEFQKILYYDFTPFNSKDPILLSLMTKHWLIQHASLKEVCSYNS